MHLETPLVQTGQESCMGGPVSYHKMPTVSKPDMGIGEVPSEIYAVASRDETEVSALKETSLLILSVPANLRGTAATPTTGQGRLL